MDELQLDPEEELKLMEEFWTNPKLNPQGFMAEQQALMMQQQVAAGAARAQPAQAQPGGGGAADLLGMARQNAIQGVANTANPLPGRPGGTQSPISQKAV